MSFGEYIGILIGILLGGCIAPLLILTLALRSMNRPVPKKNNRKD